MLPDRRQFRARSSSLPLHEAPKAACRDPAGCGCTFDVVRPAFAGSFSALPDEQLQIFRQISHTVLPLSLLRHFQSSHSHRARRIWPITYNHDQVSTLTPAWSASKNKACYGLVIISTLAPTWSASKNKACYNLVVISTLAPTWSASCPSERNSSAADQRGDVSLAGVGLAAKGVPASPVLSGGPEEPFIHGDFMTHYRTSQN